MDSKNSARNYDMGKNYKQFKLLDVATISGSRVSHFDGVKKYIATADIDLNKIISSENVSYLDRPSRADLVMTKDDVLFAKMKSTKKVLAGTPDVEDLIFSTGFYILKPNENISKKYLYFYLLSEEFNQQKDTYCSGATMAALGNTGLGRISISIPVDDSGNPDLKVQEQVACLLEEAEVLKQKREDADKKMKEVIPALLHVMFSDQNWPKEKIGTLAPNKGAIRTGPFGSQLHHAEFEDKGIPVLAIDNVVTNTFRWTQPRYLPEGKYAKFKKFRVYPGDVLVTIMGTVGRVCVAPDDLPECMSTKHLCVITVNKEKVNPIYLWASLLHDSNIRKQTRHVSKGAIMEGWNSTIIKDLLISVPPIKLQNEFAEKVKEIISLKEQQKRSVLSIDELSSSLMSRSFA